MQVVGHLLQKQAIKTTSTDRDLYARSAYNRYYYAVFLSTRSLLGTLNRDWSSLAHKSYPELLKGTISRELRRARTRAQRTGDTEFQQILTSAISAAAALAALIEKAYSVRVVADYHPSEHVDFSDSTRFSLKSVDITEAHNWESNAALWNLAIGRAWAQLDG